MEAAKLQFANADDSEELQRAELYGLLARLWLAPPDAALLQQFALAVTQAPEAGALLEGPWSALVAALRGATVAAAQDEYVALFQGVGKPEVFVYGSYYLAGFLNEKPLAQLRTDLAALGLARQASHSETEDHVAYVFEVMRYLIAGDDVAVCKLETQRRFFRAHVQTWLDDLCRTVQAHPRAIVWAHVAAFTQAFVSIETQAFDLLEQ